MGRKRGKNGFGYYFWRVLVLAALAAACVYIYRPQIEAWQQQQQKLPIEKILAQSVLKNRQFASKVQEISTDNLKAYLLEEHSNPIVSIDFSFQNAGTAAEPENRLGVSRMLTQILTAGAGKWSEQQFKDLCAEYGIKISFGSSADDFSGVLQFPSKHRQTATALFKAALNQPHIGEEYLEVVKQQTLMQLKLQQEHPESVLNNKFKEFIFAGHPYERNGLGNKQSVATMITDDLQDFRQRYLAQDNLLVGIAGDVSADEVKALLKELFGGLPEKSAGEKLSETDIMTEGAEYPIERKNAQAITRFAAQGTFRNSIDFYPLYMANYIFGEAGLNARLNKEIREKEGLTYGIYTYLSISDAAALISGGFSSTPENFAKAKQILLEQWQKLGQEGVSEEELAQAKESLIASYHLRFAAIDEIASMLTAMQKYKLGADFLDKRNGYIAEVSLTEVNAAAKKYFNTLPDFVYIGAGKTEGKK